MPQRLPFVRGSDFWVVEPTGNWSDDTRTGRRYADEFVVFAQQEDAASVLGSVVRSMIGHGRYGGVEAGFMTAIAGRAIGQAAVGATAVTLMLAATDAAACFGSAANTLAA